MIVTVSLLILMVLSLVAANGFTKIYIVVGTENEDPSGLVRDLVGSIKLANGYGTVSPGFPVIGIADIDVTNSIKTNQNNLLILLGGYGANGLVAELRDMGEINDAMVNSSPGQSWDLGGPWGGALVFTIAGADRYATAQAIDDFIANGYQPVNHV